MLFVYLRFAKLVGVKFILNEDYQHVRDKIAGEKMCAMFYQPSFAGKSSYSSFTSSCLAFPLSTLCFLMSDISIHHSSNFWLSRSTKLLRKSAGTAVLLSKKILLWDVLLQSLTWNLNSKLSGVWRVCLLEPVHQHIGIPGAVIALATFWLFSLSFGPFCFETKVKEENQMTKCMQWR